jgi:hypothetical protein
MADNAKTATPKGKTPLASNKTMPMHKKMAMGIMPHPVKSPKTPA